MIEKCKKKQIFIGAMIIFALLNIFSVVLHAVCVGFYMNSWLKVLNKGFSFQSMYTSKVLFEWLWAVFIVIIISVFLLYFVVRILVDWLEKTL